MKGFAAKRAGREGSLRLATRTRHRAASGLGFDADPVIHGGTNALLAAEVSLRRLNGDVPEKELNLFQFTARSVAQSSTGPTPMPHAA